MLFRGWGDVSLSKNETFQLCINFIWILVQKVTWPKFCQTHSIYQTWLGKKHIFEEPLWCEISFGFHLSDSNFLNPFIQTKRTWGSWNSRFTPDSDSGSVLKERNLPLPPSKGIVSKTPNSHQINLWLHCLKPICHLPEAPSLRGVNDLPTHLMLLPVRFKKSHLETYHSLL